mgnify:CR=1 FL=1
MTQNPLGWLAPIGRALLAAIFILSGVDKLQHWSDTAQVMADRGLPAVDALLSIAVGLELVGGIMVLIGLYARWGAAVLLAFLVPVSLIMHNFWAAPEPRQMTEMIHFMKNASIAGGLVFVLAVGAGPVSIDALRRRKPLGPAPTISVSVE